MSFKVFFLFFKIHFKYLIGILIFKSFAVFKVSFDSIIYSLIIFVLIRKAKLIFTFINWQNYSSISINFDEWGTVLQKQNQKIKKSMKIKQLQGNPQLEFSSGEILDYLLEISVQLIMKILRILKNSLEALIIMLLESMGN